MTDGLGITDRMSESTNNTPGNIASIEAAAFGSFTSGVALTFVTRLLMLVCVFGSSVIIGRWLGPEGLGVLAVLNVTVFLSLQVGSAGLPSANTYFIARDRKRLGPVWANALVFGLVVGTALAFVIVALAIIEPTLFGRVPFKLIAIAAVSVPFQLLLILGLNVLLAVDRIDLLNLLDLAAPALVLLNAVVVLLIMGAGLTPLVCLNSAAVILLAVVMVVVVGRVLGRQKERDACRPDLLLLKRMLSYGAKFCVSIVAGAAIFRADLLIVNHFRGAREAGVYAVASQIANLLMILPGVIATLLFPRVASAPDPSGEFALRVTRHASFLMFVICIASVAGAFVLPLLYGRSFGDAVVQLLILLPGVYLVSIESVLVQHFTGTGLPMAIPVFWLITLALSVGLNLGFVPAFGARGAAVISTICYAVIFLLVAIYFCRKTGRRPAEMLWLRRGELRDLFTRARSLVPATNTQP